MNERAVPPYCTYYLIYMAWNWHLSPHTPRFGGLELLKFVGPGFLVTTGFIDPGNWASNVAAGSVYGNELLWVVTLSTLMLILLQHNAAHLGIATGLCLSEACTTYYPPWLSKIFLLSGVGAAVATAFAELLGAAIGLQMLFGIPLRAGACLSGLFVAFMLFSNSYRRLERWIIAFVSLIGLSFLYEVALANVAWHEVVRDLFVPSMSSGSVLIVMSVLGAVVMPHNLFLHSEVIQSRQWHLQEEATIRRQLKYEFADTLIAMCVGWAINSAMIIVAASVFYAQGVAVNELSETQTMLKPLLGNGAAVMFAVALLLAGLSSSLTAAMAGGSIVAGMSGEPLDLSDSHSRVGVAITLCGALVGIFLLNNTFTGLIWSQVVLSVQLPWTVFALIVLTSSRRVMGTFVNRPLDKILLLLVAAVVAVLNGIFFFQTIVPLRGGG